MTRRARSVCLAAVLGVAALLGWSLVPTGGVRFDVAADGPAGVVEPVLGAGTAERGPREQVVATEPAPVEAQDPRCAPALAVPTTAAVVVDVRSSGTSAVVRLLRRDGAVWRCEGAAMRARVGRSGVRPLAQRVGGDGSTPGGVFGLGEMTAPNGDVFSFFGNGTDPGVSGGWHQVQPGDCWWADGGTSAYNTLVSRAAAQCTGENEYLANNVKSYSRAALIDANMGPARIGDEPGETPRAAAIFLHRFSYTSAGAPKPTSGCVSLAADDLAFVLVRLEPGATWFVIS